jgi:hypothetical protein
MAEKSMIKQKKSSGLDRIDHDVFGHSCTGDIPLSHFRGLEM